MIHFYFSSNSTIFTTETLSLFRRNLIPVAWDKDPGKPSRGVNRKAQAGIAFLYQKQAILHQSVVQVGFFLSFPLNLMPQ
jgi:hypothetical protein